MSSITSDVRPLPGGVGLPSRIVSWIPVAAPIALAITIIILRVQLGQTKFLYDGTLIVLALVCYLFAALIGLIEMYADKSVLGRWGLWMAASASSGSAGSSATSRSQTSTTCRSPSRWARA